MKPQFKREKIYLDLSKLSEEQIKEVERLTDRKIDECYLSDKLFFYDGKWEVSGGYAISKLNLTELTYSQFLDMMGESEEVLQVENKRFDREFILF